MKDLLRYSTDSRPVYRRGLHLYAVFVAAATLILITAGGIVTSLGAGLAVPDWPTSFGTWFGPKGWFQSRNIRAEHGHRLIAATVGLLIVGLCVWAHVRETRRWVRRLTWIAVIGVICQGLLGGLTVGLMLPLATSATHACLAQAIFCLLVAIAVFTSRPWIERRARGGETNAIAVRRLATVLVVLVFVQLVLGAMMRHAKDGEYVSPLAIKDFPLAMGRIVPPLDSTSVLLHFLHRLNAVLIVVTVVSVAVITWSRHRRQASLTGPVTILAILVFVQLVLGARTVHSGKAPFVTTAHVVTGAAILSIGWILLLAVHGLRPRARLETVRKEQRLVPVEGVS